MRYYLQDAWITFSYYLELVTSRLKYEHDKNPLVFRVVLGFVVVVILILSWILLIHTIERTPVHEAASSVIQPPHGPDLHSVVEVIDGDTLVVSINGNKATIRLIGINTPETVKPNSPIECFGKEATSRMKELADGSKVALEPDTTQADVDIYGRMLRYVLLEDGRNLALEMIQGGYGKEYTYDTAYKYQTQFQEAERQAKISELGLWGECKEQSMSAENSQTSQSSPSKPTATPGQPAAQSADCDPNYSPCIPHVSYDLDCGDIGITVQVTGSDRHKFDRDSDGWGCE